MKERKRVFLVNAALGVIFLPTLFACEQQNKNEQDSAASPEKDIGRVVVEAAIDLSELFFRHPLVNVLKFLKIVVNVAETIKEAIYDKERNIAIYPTENKKVKMAIDVTNPYGDTVMFQTPMQMIEFQPKEFLSANNVSEGDESAFQLLDSKIIKDYTECSDEVLMTGESNHMNMLDLRIACFEKRGYSQHNSVYLKVKHEEYKDI